MKSTLQRFDSVAVIAKDVYIDTSFILDLLQYSHRPREPRLKSSKEFYERMTVRKVHMWTDVWAVQELLWVIVRNQILNVRDQLGLQGLTYGQFKHKHSAEYHWAFTRARRFERKCFQVIRSFGFDIKIPTPFIRRGLSKAERILQYTHRIINRYDLEYSDAFHVAVARCEGTKHIVTNDQDFYPVKTIEVYTA